MSESAAAMSNPFQRPLSDKSDEMKMPQPSERLMDARNKLDDEQEMLDALKADFEETRTLMDKQINNLAKWQAEEQVTIRNIASDPTNKDFREHMDTLRGKQLVEREMYDSNQKINAGRSEMIKESQTIIKQLGEHYKQQQSAYINQVYRSNEKVLLDNAVSALVELYGWRFAVGLNMDINKHAPLGTYVDRIDIKAKQVKEKIEEQLK